MLILQINLYMLGISIRSLSFCFLVSRCVVQLKICHKKTKFKDCNLFFRWQQRKQFKIIVHLLTCALHEIVNIGSCTWGRTCNLAAQLTLPNYWFLLKHRLCSRVTTARWRLHNSSKCIWSWCLNQFILNSATFARVCVNSLLSLSAAY